MGALFAQTMGLPLQISVGANDMNTQEKFFPGVIGLGDILEKNGYSQVFMIGSDAEFGGRELFFSDHGSYEMADYYYAIDNQWIPSYYKVFWGYEDIKLFSFAKEKLTELARQNEPFNFTMLTVDTHAQDGYVCEECIDQYEGNQYANVIACSSRQVNEFINWIKAQEFYENTTIVLVGDHLTMDADFCENVAGNYERKVYTCLINSYLDVKNKNITRSYTTFDLFPTTIAALGAEIEGNRLGLGTNLFSSEETLTEKYTVKRVQEEVARKSEFMEQMLAVDTTSDSYLKGVGKYPSATVWTEYGAEQNEVQITVTDIVNLENIRMVEAEIFTDWSVESKTSVDFYLDEGTWKTKIILEEYSDGTEVGVDIYLVDKAGRRYLAEELARDMSVYEYNFARYLENLKDKNYTVFIAAFDEATSALDETCLTNLLELGLKKNLYGETRCSYYAVIDEGKVIAEELSQEKIATEGYLSDEETLYGILSGGYNAGSECHIVINGEEYAIGKRGLNIVLYDKNKKAVIDSVCFDTYSGDSLTRESGTKYVPIIEKKMVLIPEKELQISDFSEYIKKISSNERYSIFIAVRDEATKGLTDDMQESIKALGIQTDFSDKFRYSFYAIIDGKHVEEKTGKELLQVKGILKNGITNYNLTSAGCDSGSFCSIMLDGVEFAINSRGMNIVVYDNVENCVVDSVCFDTYADSSAQR